MPTVTSTGTPAKPKSGRARTGEVGSVRTLERGLSVLNALAGLREANLTLLARSVNLSPSTTYRLLETLRQQGYVEWNERSGLFTVGLRAYQVGSVFSTQSSLIGAADHEMRLLVAQAGESANLAALRGNEAVYIHQVEGPGLMRMFTQLGASAPLHCSGVGKVLLAWLPDAQVTRKLGEGPYPAFTPHSITTLPDYLAELSRVRHSGYALDDEERELGVRCLAVPVRDASRDVVGALSLSASTSRFPKKDVPARLQQVQQAAHGISARLGWTP